MVAVALIATVWADPAVTQQVASPSQSWNAPWNSRGVQTPLVLQLPPANLGTLPATILDSRPDLIKTQTVHRNGRAGCSSSESFRKTAASDLRVPH
jgi:hypothetical protein